MEPTFRIARSSCLTYLRSLPARGGVTPFNVIPVPNASGRDSGGAWGHPAATPEVLCSFWVRYICPPGGTVLDMFAGSGTVALAAIKAGRSFIGCDAKKEYVAIARKRVARLLGGKLARDPRAARVASPSEPARKNRIVASTNAN